MASFTGLGSPTKALRLITSQTGGRNRDPKGGTPIRQTLHTKRNQMPSFARALEPRGQQRSPDPGCC